MPRVHRGRAAKRAPEASCEVGLIGVAHSVRDLRQRVLPGPNQFLCTEQSNALEVRHRTLAGTATEHARKVKPAHSRTFRETLQRDRFRMMLMHVVQRSTQRLRSETCGI